MKTCLTAVALWIIFNVIPLSAKEFALNQFLTKKYDQDCMTFDLNLSLIQVTDIKYAWVIDGKGNTVESISFIIVNNSDNCVEGIKYKISIYDPKGKALYNSIEQEKGFINGRGKSNRQSIYFDKPISSKWTFLPSTHPLKFEALEINQNKKRTSEYIAWQIDNKMKGCPESTIERACKLMIQIYPNIIKERENESTVDWVYRKYGIYLDDKKRNEFEEAKAKIKNKKDLSVLANSNFNNGNFKDALDNYIQLVSLLNDEDAYEKPFKDMQYVSIAECYDELKEYEKAGDTLMSRFSSQSKYLISAARLYFKGSNFIKSINCYSKITYPTTRKFTTNSLFIGYEHITMEDWENYKKCIDECKKSSDQTSKDLCEEEKYHYLIAFSRFSDVTKLTSIDYDKSTYYTVNVFNGAIKMGEVTFQIESLPVVSKEIKKEINDWVIHRTEDTSLLFGIYPNTGLFLGLKEDEISNAKSYTWNTGNMKAGATYSKWDIALVHNPLNYSATPIFFIYTGRNGGKNDALGKYFQLKNCYRVGKVISGFDILERINNDVSLTAISAKQKYERSELPNQFPNIYSSENFPTRELKLIVKRKFD